MSEDRDRQVASLEQELNQRMSALVSADPQCSFVRGAIAALKGELPVQQDGSAPQLKLEPDEGGSGTLG